MPENTKQSVQSTEPSTHSVTRPKPIVWVAGVVLVLILMAGSAAAGAFIANAYERPGQPGGNRMIPGNFGGNIDRGDGMRQQRSGNGGEVTKISSTSITIKDERTGGETTFGVNDDTTVRKDNANAAISDIKVGDTVSVRPTMDDDDNLLTFITIRSDD